MTQDEMDRLDRERRLATRRERKLAQMAAYFLKLAGGRMDVEKLMWLMYLADREHFASYGCPISGDKYYWMDDPFGRRHDAG